VALVVKQRVGRWAVGSFSGPIVDQAADDVKDGKWRADPGSSSLWTAGFEALATLVYGPLRMDEYRVGLGTKVAVLLLCAALVTIGVATEFCR
jgi:hypothetical protein